MIPVILQDREFPIVREGGLTVVMGICTRDALSINVRPRESEGYLLVMV